MADVLSVDHAELLARVDLFAGLEKIALARLAACVEPVSVADGTPVCRQGEPADALYVVSRGTFGVFVASPDGEARLGAMGRGEYFGEMALLTGQTRSTTVRADGAGEVLRVERNRFLDLFREDPSLPQAIIATLSDRLRNADIARLESSQAVAQAVDRGLATLPLERRRRLFEASVLENTPVEAYRALFGPDAQAVRSDFEALTGGGASILAPIRAALRRRFEMEVGPEGLRAFALDSAARLEAAGRWEDALAVVARYGQQATMVAALGRALRAMPPVPEERAMPWVESLGDEEAMRDPQVALLRAALHERQGDVTTAAAVLRGSLGTALTVSESSSSPRVAAELMRLTGLQTPGQPMWRVRDWRAAVPTVRQTASRLLIPLALAVPLTVGAAVVSSTHPQAAFVLLLAAAIAMWVAEVLPDFAVGLVLIIAWVLFGLTTPSQALAGFASANWLFAFAILGMAAAVARSGLLFRAGLLLVRRMPPGLFWQAGALLLTGVILTPILPHAQGRVAITAPLALTIGDALRLREREPRAALLGMAACIGSTPLHFTFLTGSQLCLLAWALLPESSRLRFDWIHWLGATAPLALFVGLAAFTSLFLVFHPGASAAPTRERVNVQLAVLGPMSAREVGMLGLLMLTMVGWIAAPALRIDVSAVAGLGLVGAVVVGAFDRRSLQGLDWNYLVFYGAVLGISGLTVSLGLDRAVAEAVGPRLRDLGGGPIAIILIIAGINLMARLVLSQSTAVLLLCLTLIPIGPSVGVDPWVVIVTILATSAVWWLPSQTPSYLITYSATEGRLFSHSQARRVAFIYTAITLAGLVLSVPYWHALGLL